VRSCFLGEKSEGEMPRTEMEKTPKRCVRQQKKIMGSPIFNQIRKLRQEAARGGGVWL